MDRYVLSDAQYERIAPLLPGKAGDPGRTAKDSRPFTGTPWRDLYPKFGDWNSVFQRFRRWALKGVFESLLKQLSPEPDFEYAIVDGTIVGVYRQGASARGGLRIRHRTIAGRPYNEDRRPGQCAQQPG